MSKVQEVNYPFQSNRARTVLKKLISFILCLVVILTLFLIYLVAKPINSLSNLVKPIQQMSYLETINQIKEIQNQEGDDINSVCKTSLLSNGQKTKKVIVMFHGYTNCPAQFSKLSQEFFALGFNIYIPRLPQHGLSDRLTNNQDKITTAELANTTTKAIEIASGLGEEITLFGISGGSVMAAWGGYNYKEVKKVFILAPLFTPAGISNWQLRGFYNFLGLLPSYYRWWDEESKERIEGPSYAYPRFSLKAIEAFMGLSLDLYSNLNQHTKDLNQVGKELILVTGEKDKAIDNQVASYTIQKWASIPGTTIVQYQFPSSLGLVHDFIDPNQKKAKIDLVYPKLTSLLKNY
jgi:esterase/lipase